MAAFIFRRLLQGVLVVALVTTVVFILIHAAPGDPFGDAMDNPNVTEGLRQSWRHSYGLDQPRSVQFVRYVENVLQGELGFSFSRRRDVSAVLADALPQTLFLMTLGLAGGFLIGIVVAIAQVRNRGKSIDKALGGLSLAFFAVPDFVLALLIVASLPLLMHLPSGGATIATYDDLSGAERIADRLSHVVLPAVTLALLYFPVIARHQRAALLDVLPSEYVTTARAKGVGETSIIWHHALRNALLPVITLLGVAFPALFTGAVFVEKIFSWPGMGSVIVGAVGARDYPLLTASVIVSATFVVAGSILADILYRLLDPRIRNDR